MNRLTFLSHFVICLAVSAAAWFAHVNGVFATVWANDASHMTSAIAALFVGTDAPAILGELSQRRNAYVPGTSGLFYPSGGCMSSW